MRKEYKYKASYNHYAKGGIIIKSRTRMVKAKNMNEAKQKIRKIHKPAKVWGIVITRV